MAYVTAGATGPPLALLPPPALHGVAQAVTDWAPQCAPLQLVMACVAQVTTALLAAVVLQKGYATLVDTAAQQA